VRERKKHIMLTRLQSDYTQTAGHGRCPPLNIIVLPGIEGEVKAGSSWPP